MFLIRTSFLLLTAFALTACDGEPAPSTPTQPAASAPAAKPAGNLLRMTIDGTDWIADSGVWAAVDPMGAKGAVLMSGNIGHGRDQQTFNLNMEGVMAPGSYPVAAQGTPDFGIAQIGNLSPQMYLVGGAMMDHDLTVDIVALRAAPVAVEARFSGTMEGPGGKVLHIEAGEFRYSE